MSNVEVVKPGNADYDTLSETLQKEGNQPVERRAFDYDPMVKKYNDAPVGSIILAPDEATSIRKNMARLLANRGGVEGEDFEVYKPRVASDGSHIPTSERTLVVRKLTSVELRMAHSRRQ